MKKHFNSRYPHANLKQSNETVATDTKWWTGKPALDDGIVKHGGATGAQVFTGVTSKYLDIYPVKSDAEFPNTLLNHFRCCGVPNKLFTDGARAEISLAVQDILRTYCVDHAMSEPHYQHQNPAERRIQDLQAATKAILSITGAPDELWFLCMQYVVDLTNHTAMKSLNNRTPFEKKFGYAPDISKFLHF